VFELLFSSLFPQADKISNKVNIKNNDKYFFINFPPY